MSLLPSKPENAASPQPGLKPDLKRRALGRGLEVLLPARQSVAIQATGAPDGTPFEIDVNLIERNPFQTRTTFDEAKLAELAQSIAATGVVQPIAVRELDRGRYQLITGERRLMASKQVGKTTIPAVVRAVSDEQAMEMTIVENLQRADLNPIEQARAYHRLATDFRMTQEQMALRTGKDRASVGNFLRLLKLPESVQRQVESGTLSFGHAKALLALPLQAIAPAAQKVVALSFNVRQTESYVQGLLHPEGKAEKARKVIEPLDPNVNEARGRLQRALGLHVKIEDKHGKGRVIIEYSGLEDFDLILSALNAHDDL
jgi:ParB family chromosome partitioning protein